MVERTYGARYRALALVLAFGVAGCGDDSGTSVTLAPTSLPHSEQDTSVAEDTDSPGVDSGMDATTPDTARDSVAPDTRRDTSVAPDTAPTCSAALFDCNGTCIDVRGTDPRNCGRCARSCGHVGTAGPACRDGACYCPSGLCESSFLHCTLPQEECLGACHELATDPLSCGACGVICAAGESCSGGRCCAGSRCSSCGDGICRSPYEDRTSCPADC